MKDFFSAKVDNHNKAKHLPLILGVDIGGTHITAALVDIHERKILSDTFLRQTVDSAQPAGEIIDAWVSTIQRILSATDAPVLGIGIAMPGPFDYEAGVSLIKEQQKFQTIYRLNIKDILSERLHIDKSKIVFSNDAACFLQGELYSGLAKDQESALGLTFGSGLGSARSAKNQCIDADLWHQPFLDGIVEDFLSSSWLLGQYEQRSGNSSGNVKELADKARLKKDPTAIELFAEFGKNIALFLIPILALENYSSVVLGGNISNAWDLFSQSLLTHLRNENILVSIQPSQLGEHASLLGAVSFCHSSLNTIAT